MAAVAYIVGVGPRPGTVKARCPFCGCKHIHPRPRRNLEPAQQPPCGSPTTYQLGYHLRADMLTPPEGHADE